MWSNKAEKKAKRGGATDAAMDAYLELADKVIPKLLLIKLLQTNPVPGYPSLSSVLSMPPLASLAHLMISSSLTQMPGARWRYALAASPPWGYRNWCYEHCISLFTW